MIDKDTAGASGFALLQLSLLLVVAGLIAGGLLMGGEIMERYRIYSQMTQIASFDEAVGHFHDKFNGLPGDLIAIMAERQGLPSGNGTPGHGDGDGNISPCNLGWQWHLGCETALFWSHLSVTGMISGNFTADSRFTDTRLSYVGAMGPYLPRSPLAEGVYVAVWNTNASQPSPRHQLPYGNYYELSRIEGVSNEKMVDNPLALTPKQSYALDAKMDDGMPLTGRVVVNGEANWPKDAWGSYARPGISNCVAPDETYNTQYFLRADALLCHVAIKLGCCTKAE